jgi:hypothetical protein
MTEAYTPIHPKPRFDRKYFDQSSCPIVTEEPKKNPQLPLIVASIIAAIIILALLGIIVYLYLRKPVCPASTTSTSTTSTSTTSTTTTLGGAGGACTSDRNCNTGLVCDTTTCKVPAGGTCSTNADCDSRAPLCIGGTCLGNFNAGCTSTSQCAQPFVCTNNLCSPVVCTTTADCRDPTTQNCFNQDSSVVTGIGKQCILNIDQSCDYVDQCTGQVSPYNEVCINVGGSNNVCKLLGGRPCLSNDQCATGTCTAGICSCTNNFDCSLVTPTCTAGICV